MTKKTRQWGIAAMAAVLAGAPMLLLAGCGAQPSDDRPDAAADAYKDTSKVTIWRNADGAPNVVRFCADGLAWAATLSSDGAKSPQLLRVPERDEVCAQR